MASTSAVEATPMIPAGKLRGRDITVNAVAPGPPATELFFDGEDQVDHRPVGEAPAAGAAGHPGRIAEVVAFLAGPGRWINGQVVVRADGGMV